MRTAVIVYTPDPGPADPIDDNPDKDQRPDDEQEDRAHHTARDIPALLREARTLFQAGNTDGMRMLGDILLLSEEYVMSTHICQCGGQLDKTGGCLDCARMAAARERAVETAAAVDGACGF